MYIKNKKDKNKLQYIYKLIIIKALILLRNYTNVLIYYFQMTFYTINRNQPEAIYCQNFYFFFFYIKLFKNHFIIFIII